LAHKGTAVLSKWLPNLYLERKKFLKNTEDGVTVLILLLVFSFFPFSHW
jgi:hypothetical protein